MTEKELKRKKKKFLLSIKKDIYKLDDYISSYKDDELAIRALVNSKTNLVKLQSIAPYVLSVFFTSCFSFFVFRDVPFFVNNVKEKEYLKKDVDSLGNISYEQQYDAFDEVSTISSYSAWSRDSDGYYSRDVVVYYADMYSLDELDEILLSGNISSDIFLKKIEKRSSLSSTDNVPYLKYTVYEEYETDSMVLETEKHNITYTVIWLLMTLFSEAAVAYWRDNYSDFSYYERVQDIYQKYLPNGSDVDVMKEILGNRVKNYELLKVKK